MKAKKLIKHGFDNMENIYADTAECLGIFIDEKEMTAHKKIDNLLKTLSDIPYLGHDNNVYPKYEVIEVETN